MTYDYFLHGKIELSKVTLASTGESQRMYFTSF